METVSAGCRSISASAPCLITLTRLTVPPARQDCSHKTTCQGIYRGTALGQCFYVSVLPSCYLKISYCLVYILRTQHVKTKV